VAVAVLFCKDAMKFVKEVLILADQSQLLAAVVLV
jgi:hypothetical protein